MAAQPEVGDDVEITPGGRTIVHKAEGTTGVGVDASVQAASDELEQEVLRRQPAAAAEQLAKLENQAIRHGQEPQGDQAVSLEACASHTQEAKLLTILVEFDENANDDFTGEMVPDLLGLVGVHAGQRPERPAAQQHPEPGRRLAADNNSMWVKDFSSGHFNKMLFSDKGITKRVRPDLTGPDGKRGIDISGYTMKNMYEEMSRGAYTVSGEATPWVKVPHSEAYYGAQRCFQNDAGEWEAGAYQSMNGHPDNPLGAGQLPDRRRGGARRAAARLPVGGLRHRGPGRPRRRRQRPRAGRRHRPRGARPRG